MMKKENNNTQHSGFKVPNGYFDSFEERVLSRIEQQNPLNNIKKSGFTVPDNYFSTVQDKIVYRAYPTVTSKPKIFTLKRLIYVSGIAASILLLIKLANISDSNFSIDNLQTTSIEEYILEEDINEYELAQMLEMDEESIFDYTNGDINLNKLEDYLIENTTIDDLIEE